jgi:hypothetical protein
VDWVSPFHVWFSGHYLTVVRMSAHPCNFLTLLSPLLSNIWPLPPPFADVFYERPLATSLILFMVISEDKLRFFGFSSQISGQSWVAANLHTYDSNLLDISLHKNWHLLVCCRFLVPDNTRKILTEIWHHFWLKIDGEKRSRKNYFKVQRWPSELLLPSAKKSAQKGWIGLAG